MAEKNSEKNILQLYLSHLGKTAVLSREKEAEFARRAKKGDKTAADLIVVSNLRFVVKMAFMNKGLGVPVLDLINEGNIGLLYALRRFDPEAGVRFITFARHYVRHFIIKALFEQSSSIRVPYRRAMEAARVREAAGEKPLEERVVSRPLSLDQLVANEENTEPALEFVCSDSYSPPDGPVMKKTMRGIIEESLKKLKPFDRDIVQRRFGLGGREMHTLSEIGRVYRLTRQRIRQKLQSALEKIKYPLQKREAFAFLN